MSEVDWPRVAVVGAGAVGGYFGGMLAQAGAPVEMIGRKPFVDAVSRNGLSLERDHTLSKIPVKASTELSAVREADLVLFSVKAVATSDTARELAPFLAPDSILLTLQNGVDNVERIRDVADITVIAAAVYVAASVPEPGYIRHVARGDLVIGPESHKTRDLEGVLTRAGIPCRISNNIEGELWLKLLWNVALNAISALSGARNSEIAQSPDARELVRSLVEEVLLVAHAADLKLPGISDAQTAFARAIALATQLGQSLSSTAQDLHRGKRTEIDSLNGYIVRKAAELGLHAPVNQALYTLVKLAEQRAMAGGKP